MGMRAKSRVRGGQLKSPQLAGCLAAEAASNRTSQIATSSSQSCLATGVEVMCRGKRTSQLDMNHEMRSRRGRKSLQSPESTRLALHPARPWESGLNTV